MRLVHLWAEKILAKKGSDQLFG